MDSREAPSITAALQHQVRSGATATQIAGSVAATWRHVEESLVPIIGPQGVAGLYRRSLLLTSRTHSWLAGLDDGTPSIVDLTVLTAVLAQQGSNDAALAGGELLQTFYGLLSSLIGPSLTQKLLGFMGQPF